jgi:cyclopropane-fatty-acyl-phospholipid synthase
MFEHVGENKLPLYFQHAYELLRTGGLFLNHGIALRVNEPKPKGPNFMSRYVFPDGDLVPINATLRFAEAVGFEVRDVESLREHYALTLRHWARRLELAPWSGDRRRGRANLPGMETILARFNSRIC